MNLIEAVKSGRPFKRPNDRHWWFVDEYDKITMADCVDTGHTSVHIVLPPTVSNIFADDWEIQEPEVGITRTQFWEAVLEISGTSNIDQLNSGWWGMELGELAKRLGLE